MMPAPWSPWSRVWPLLVLGLIPIPPAVADGRYESERHCFVVETAAAGLERPWGMAFLPDGDLLITELGGRLLRLSPDGERTPIAGLPEIAGGGQGGLLDVTLHPDYSDNRWVFLSYSAGGAFRRGTDVTRARLADDRLEDLQLIFSMRPRKGSGRHFGSRLLFAPDGTLYVTLGDRGDRDSAQDLEDHSGAIVRIHDDGRIPADNPIDPASAIYSHGHRNVQGIAYAGALLWAHEHGPMGGDELNLVLPGRNYGWPVITYGKNYVTGTSIGEGTHREGMEQPVHYWVPSIGPSGLAYYDGDAFPEWRGSLFIGALKFSLLVRLEMDGERLLGEERLLEDRYGRIRDVRQSPDGLLYLLTDASPGALLRLSPCT